MHRVTALLLFLTTFLLAACNLGTAAITPSPTPELPSVEFLFPANNARVEEGTDLTLDILASDKLEGIARVELYADGQLVNEARPTEALSVTDFRVEMNWIAQGAGTLHTLAAIAYRLDGTPSDQAAIVVEVVPSESQ